MHQRIICCNPSGNDGLDHLIIVQSIYRKSTSEYSRKCPVQQHHQQPNYQCRRSQQRISFRNPRWWNFLGMAIQPHNHRLRNRPHPLDALQKKQSYKTNLHHHRRLHRHQRLYQHSLALRRHRRRPHRLHHRHPNWKKLLRKN